MGYDNYMYVHGGEVYKKAVETAKEIRDCFLKKEMVKMGLRDIEDRILHLSITREIEEKYGCSNCYYNQEKVCHTPYSSSGGYKCPPEYSWA